MLLFEILYWLAVVVFLLEFLLRTAEKGTQKREKISHNMPAPGNGEQGRKSAEERLEDIERYLHWNTVFLVITCGAFFCARWI